MPLSFLTQNTGEYYLQVPEAEVCAEFSSSPLDREWITLRISHQSYLVIRVAACLCTDQDAGVDLTALRGLLHICLNNDISCEHIFLWNL